MLLNVLLVALVPSGGEVLLQLQPGGRHLPRRGVVVARQQPHPPVVRLVERCPVLQPEVVRLTGVARINIDDLEASAIVNGRCAMNKALKYMMKVA